MSQVHQDEVACHDQYTQGKLKRLVSNGLYPPAIHCVVTYKYAPDFEVIDHVLNVKMIGTDKPKVSFPVKVYSAKGECMWYIVCINSVNHYYYLCLTMDLLIAPRSHSCFSNSLVTI